MPLYTLAIQNALRQDNINPEIEEKLLNLQRCHEKQMKGVHQNSSVALANNHHEYTSPGKYSSPSRKHSSKQQFIEDNEWVLDTLKRRPLRNSSFSEKQTPQNITVAENDINQIIRSVAEETKSNDPNTVTTTDGRIPNKKYTENVIETKKTEVVPLKIEKNIIDQNGSPFKKDSEMRKNMQVSLF